MRKRTMIGNMCKIVLLCILLPNAHERTGFVSSFTINSIVQAAKGSHSSCNLDMQQQHHKHRRIPGLPMRALINNDNDTSRRSPFGGRFRRNRRGNQRQQQNNPSTMQMTFLGEKRVVTSPVPMPYDATVLDEFFSEDKYRNLLFPKNDATIFRGSIPQNLIDTWRKEAELGGATGPVVLTNKDGTIELSNSSAEHQKIIKITTLLQMPSLQIRSESTIGVKLLLSDRKGNGSKSNEIFPEFQFTLLKSDLIPEGSTAAKWIFNQLIQYRDSTSSFTRVTAEILRGTDDNHGGGDITRTKNIVFTTDARLETKIHIPAAVLKYLPAVNVSKYEQQGSESIQRLLEKDLEPALVGFRNAFKTFAEEKTSAVVEL
mmetsp:Transcript_15351/g.22501  ORF Transcript_15351/g.22501 Transcript_15351/m.22501 type:complete len:373 (+) Transcript_15351:22-1140(+)